MMVQSINIDDIIKNVEKNSVKYVGMYITAKEDMINKGYDLSADVLKVGHHGSNTSTSQVFLNKVKPKYAVISVGKGNDYGHPTAATMRRLQSNGIRVFRTDENGTIICTSDGKNISFNCNPGDYTSGGGSSGTSSDLYQ